MKLSTLIRTYLDSQSAYCKPRSLNSYRESLLRILAFIGDVDVELLSDKDVEGFIQHRRASVKPISINKDLRPLKQLLRFGLERGLLKSLPVKVQLLRVPRKKDVKVLSPQDIEHLLSKATGRVYGILLIASSTGFRTEEILRLSWDDVDFDAGTLAVTAKDGWLPKSHTNRQVYVGERLLSYLKELREKSLFNKGADYIFSTRRGTCLTLFNTCRDVRKVFEEAGLYRAGESTTHRIRHSFATILLEKGTSIEVVREILGHADIVTTAKYAHATEKAKKAASAHALV